MLDTSRAADRLRFADGLRVEAAGSVVSLRDTVATLSYDRDFWEQLWSRTLRERAGDVARRPPNAHLTAEVGGLRGARLDAGCGHESDTLWLAAHGWQITAVDFSAAALAHARSTAEAAGAGRRRACRLGRRQSGELDPAAGSLRPGCLPLRPRAGISGGDRAADRGSGRARRDSVAGRASPSRPGHGSRDARRRSGPGPGRASGRRARSPPVGGRRRRGPPPGRSQHRRRRRDPCATLVPTSYRAQ